MNEESQFGYTTDNCYTTRSVDLSTNSLWNENQFYPQWDFDEMTTMSWTIAVLFVLNALFCVVVIVHNLITMIMDVIWLSQHKLHTKSQYFTGNINQGQTNTKSTKEHTISRIKDIYHTYFDDDTTGWIILHITGELLEFFIQSQALLLYGGYNMWDPHHSNDIYLANKPEFITIFAVILAFNCAGSGLLWLSYALAPQHCFGTVFTVTIFIIDKFSDLCYTVFPFYVVIQDRYNKNTNNVFVLFGQLHINSLLAFVAAFMPLMMLTLKSFSTARSAQQALHDEYYAQWKCVVDIAKHSDNKAALYAAQLDGFSVTAADLAKNRKEIFDSSGQMTLQFKSNAKRSWIHNDDGQNTICIKRMFLVALSACFIVYCVVILSSITSYLNESKVYCSSIEEAKYYDLVNGTYALKNRTLSSAEIHLFDTNPELFFWDECIYPVYAFSTSNRCQCRVFVIDWTNQISSETQRTDVFNISQSMILDKMLSNWIMMEKFRTIGSKGNSVFLVRNNLSFPAFSKLRAFEWQDAQIDSIHGIASCSRLEYLFFGKTSIVSLPDDFGGLKQMKYLSLTFNGFTEVPSSICALTKLTALQIEFELTITSIPYCIGDLTELTELLIDGCMLLSDIPISIFSLPNLADLSLFKADLSYEGLLAYNMPKYGVDYHDNDTSTNAEWFNDHFQFNNDTTYWLALSPICEEEREQYPIKLQYLLNTTCDYPCEVGSGKDTLCIPRMFGDGWCDGICQQGDCYMDGGDCVQLCFANGTNQYTNCSWDKLFNEVCDEGCDNRFCMQYPVDGDLQTPTTTTYWNGTHRLPQCYAADNFQCEIHTNEGQCERHSIKACAASESIYLKNEVEEVRKRMYMSEDGDVTGACVDEFIGDGECDDACRTDECFQDKGDCERGCLGGTEISACFGLWKAWTVLIGEGIYKINHSYACNVILPLGLAWLDIDASVDDCWGKVTYYDWNFDSHINFREFVIVARNFAGAGRTKSVQLNCSACSGVENYNV